MWDEGQFRIFGVDSQSFGRQSGQCSGGCCNPDDVDELRKAMIQFNKGARSYEAEFRIIRPDG